jgi:predicted house-cleaning noncanonical NTP pyrophosphatase (MazG superfamily)
MLRLTLFLTLLWLAACAQGEVPTDRMMAHESAAAPAMAGADVAPESIRVSAARAPGPAQPDGPAALPDAAPATLIAYSYATSIELPAKRVIELRDAHLKACNDAGVQRCQLLGTSSNTSGEETITAELRLRGEPQWLAGFREGLTADVAKLEGRIISNSIGSEDLTRQIIDTEATLRAQTKLRDRLEELLAKHQGKLADLLEVERELARVQGEIDARASELKVMRMRIAMSELVLSYVSRGVLVSDRTADPTLQALYDFLNVVSASFAALIRFVAGILPWLLLAVPLLWLLRRWWRRR